MKEIILSKMNDSDNMPFVNIPVQNLKETQYIIKRKRMISDHPFIDGYTDVANELLSRAY